MTAMKNIYYEPHERTRARYELRVREVRSKFLFINFSLSIFLHCLMAGMYVVNNFSDAFDEVELVVDDVDFAVSAAIYELHKVSLQFFICGFGFAGVWLLH
jgi:hypothetical protein